MREKVHKLIMEHCSDTLEEINFLGLDHTLEFTKPFPNVKSLYFHDGSFHHSMNAIAEFFPNVETLHFNDVKGLSWNWGFKSHYIPSLISFDDGYDCSHYVPRPNMGYFLGLGQLNYFIILNPQLEKLSASLNSHRCDDDLFYGCETGNDSDHSDANDDEEEGAAANDNQLKPLLERVAGERNHYDHPMSFKITVQSCSANCIAIDRLIIPFERVHNLELCLKKLNASKLITKCCNIRSLKLYLRYDSNLFNASYFNNIATALPLLEELVLSLHTKTDTFYRFFAYMDNPPLQQPELMKYENGTISSTILPFVRQCKQLFKIDFRFTFDEVTDSKAKFARKWIEDVGDFGRIIRQEKLIWESKNIELNSYKKFGYEYSLTK